MRKWLWFGVGGMLLVFSGFVAGSALQGPHSLLGHVVLGVCGTGDETKPVLPPAPVPLAGTAGHAPAPPPESLPRCRDVETIEPIALDPFQGTVEPPLAVPREVVETIPPPRPSEAWVAGATFMPPALEDFGTPYQRMPYADEDESGLEVIAPPSPCDAEEADAEEGA